jgi:hypothetical protein
VDNDRRLPAPIAWLRNFLVALGGGTGLGIQCDIVVYEQTTMREVYRVGPYNGWNAAGPKRRLVDQINKIGLDEFLRARQIEEGHLGPVRRSSERMSIDRQIWEACKTWVSVAVDRLLRR